MAATDRTRVRRVAERAAYDTATLYAILDAAMVCHVGFIHQGSPVVIPTLYARVGDDLVLHGAAGSRMLRTLQTGAELSIAVTLVDGLVLARSVFHHSVNYRSVVIFGTAEAITDRDQKLQAMRELTERLVPGRWDAVRGPSPAEFRQTVMLRIPIEEASAKVRTGPPGDDEADLGREVWAGVVPLRIVAGAAEDDPLLPPGVEVPAHVRALIAGYS